MYTKGLTLIGGIALSCSAFSQTPESTAPVEPSTPPAEAVEPSADSQIVEAPTTAPEAAPVADTSNAQAPTVEPYTDTVPVASTEEATPDEVAAAPESRSRLVEEIVVTAQKREENLQEVPISIAAFSADALDARGAFDTKALASITPAVSLSEFGGYSFIYIRGVGTDAFVPSADPSVTTYIDGVFVPTSQGFATDFGGVQRVEVLKGPQGTLFGRNSTGGAISVVTKRPGGDFEASLQGQLGNYNERRTKLYVNAPITDWLGISVDGLYKVFDSQYTHLHRELTPSESRAGRARINIHPLDELDFDLTYFRSNQEGTGSLVSKNIRPSPLFSAIIPTEEDNYKAQTDNPADIKGYYEVKSVGVTWGLPWFDFKLSGSDQINISTYTAYDFDGSEVPLVAFSAEDQYTDAQSAELQLVSRPDGWLGDSFEWVVGSYYLKSDGGFGKITLLPAQDLISFVLARRLMFPEGLVDLFDPLDNAINQEVTLSGILGTKSISGYSQVTWHARDWLDLTLGGRYQDEDRYLIQAHTDVPDPVTGEPTRLLSFPLDRTNTKNLSTKAVISVKPQDGWLFYLSRSEGFKSATYNIINIYTPPDYVKPEEVVAYELGMKADFFGGALRLNSAIFNNQIKDKQVSFVSLLAGGAVSLNNAEEAEISGAEFDLLLSPFPSWNPGLVVTANGAYLDTKYNKYTQGQGYDEDTGLYGENFNYTGNEIERTPEFSGGLGITQTLDAGANGELEVGVDAYYNSGFWYSAENKDGYEEGSYTLTNARLSYLYRPWDLRVTAFGKNILDERYHTGLFETDFGILSNLAYRSQFGLRLDWNF